eukprot:scaffold113066_cov12-Tisochrysis_lutea.AAC.1
MTSYDWRAVFFSFHVICPCHFYTSDPDVSKPKPVCVPVTADSPSVPACIACINASVTFKHNA